MAYLNKKKIIYLTKKIYLISHTKHYTLFSLKYMQNLVKHFNKIHWKLYPFFNKIKGVGLTEIE